MNKPPVICLDGPSGVGKGTICLLVAQHLHWHILDSGSLYRLTAFKAAREGIVDNEQALVAQAENLHIDYQEVCGELRIYLDNEEVSSLIRTEEIGLQASKLATIPSVRTALLARQRSFLQPPGLVADGRDMGTVVFPEALLKIFLTASVEERAQRRYKQLKEKRADVTLASVIKDLQLRDTRDRNRATAPLKPAEDAIIIDTTENNIKEVSEKVMQWVNKRIIP